MSAAIEQEHHRSMDEAADVVRNLAGDVPRPLVVVTGSGLAPLSEVLSIERRISLNAIPHMPRPTAPGHLGEILLGRMGTLGAIFFTGRVHLYEGFPPEEIVSAIRLASRLGGKILLATNAAGGVNPLLQPGDLMMLTDHINLTFRNPLIGCREPNRRLAASRSWAGSPYDVHLCETLREAARREKINLKEGVYAANLGPTYETRAEAVMLGEIGADAVGMSTVAEVVAARHAGMKTVAISCIANRVPLWGQPHTLTHNEVIERVGTAVERLKPLIVQWVKLVADDAGR